MNRPRSLLSRLKEIAIAVNLTLRREGSIELLRRSLKWLSGERRFKKKLNAYGLPSPIPYTAAAYGAAGKLTVTGDHNASLSCVIILTGLPAQLEYDAYLLLQAVNTWHRENPLTEIIVVTDGPIWKHIARVCSPSIKVVHHAEKCDLPNRLFQSGLMTASKAWIAFALPGVDAGQWLKAVCELSNYVQGPDCIGVAGRYGDSDLASTYSLDSHRVHRGPNQHPDPRYPAGSYPGGWIEMLDMVPLHNCILNRTALVDLGGFAQTDLLRRDFWWEACIRLSRNGYFATIPLAAPLNKWTLNTIPLPAHNHVSLDTRARLALRYHGVGESTKAMPSEAVLSAVESVRAIWPTHPVKITILSGPFEPHHNQIFFYNYFHLVEDCGLLSWRVIDDEYATTADVSDSDLIILCRVRSENGCKILDQARRLGKPVLYMLDDNWYKMGSDWSEYRKTLAPDSDFLRNARYCIRNATAAITFNPVMRDYLKADASHIFELPMNIDLRLFDAVTPTPPAPQKDTSRLHIGYAGSPRPQLNCFKALVQVARRHPNVIAHYIGWKPPEILHSIAPDQLHLVPGTFSIREYARTLSALALDIGLAPLGNTESDRSKNPTKYLDYAAVRCAGIYSPVDPYTAHVTNRETGIFVEGNSCDAWVDAIETLITDTTLRERLQMQSYLDVKRRFSTEVILPDFLKMLADLMTLEQTA